MRLSLELIVVAVVILVVAVVILTIFTGGMQNFMEIFGGQTDHQLKISMCQSACSSYCMVHPDVDEGSWGDPGLNDITYKGEAVDCAAIYNSKCEC